MTEHSDFFPTRQGGVVRFQEQTPRPTSPCIPRPPVPKLSRWSPGLPPHPPCIPRPPDPKLSRVSPRVPGSPAPSPSTKTRTQHDRTEQSMTQHDRTAHTRAEHDRTHQPFSPPDRLGLLDFKNRPPGHPPTLHTAAARPPVVPRAPENPEYPASPPRRTKLGWGSLEAK